MAHACALQIVRGRLSYTLCRHFCIGNRPLSISLKALSPITRLGVSKSVNYSAFAIHRTLLKHDLNVRNDFRLQKRMLVNRSRRPVPFSMASYIYTELIEPNEESQKNNDRATGLSLIGTLNRAANPKDQMKKLSTSDIIVSLYAWPKQANLSSNRISKSVVKNLYEDSNKKSGRQFDMNLYLQLELSKRIKTEDLETLFLGAHAVFCSRGATLRYLTYFFDHILINFDQLPLSKSQVVKLLFYIYYFGDAPESLFFKLEGYFSKHIEEFDINSFHIISIGFFRANKRITDYDILETMAERLLLNLENVSGDALVSIMKIFRHSSFVKVSFFTELAEKLVILNLKNVKSLNQIMHIAMAYGSLRLYNEEFLKCLVLKGKQIVNNVPASKVRTKDLGRLVWAMGTFNYRDEEFLMKRVVPVLTESLGKSVSILYPESLMDVAMGMAYVGLYADTIVNAIFAPETAVKLRDHPLLEKTNQLLYLHHSVKIEHPSYCGNRLSQNFLDTLPEKVYGSMDREISFRQGLSSSLNTLISLLGKEKVRCHFILPHFHTADLELHLDHSGHPVELDHNSGQLEVSSAKNHTRIAIQVIGQNQCAVNSDTLLGNSRTKMRQLKKLGYVTHVVSPDDAQALDCMDQTLREEYYRNILRNEIKVKI